MQNGLMFSYLKPIALGALVYIAVKQLRKTSASGVSASGEESDVYARLEELRKRIVSTTDRYDELSKKSGDLDLEIAQVASGYDASATVGEKVQTRAKVVELTNERDQNLIEMGLLARELNSLRQQIIAEDARLKAAVTAPIIAQERTSGMGEEPGYLAVPITPFQGRPSRSDVQRELVDAKRKLIKARGQLDLMKRRFTKKWGQL